MVAWGMPAHHLRGGCNGYATKQLVDAARGTVRSAAAAPDRMCRLLSRGERKDAPLGDRSCSAPVTEMVADAEMRGMA